MAEKEDDVYRIRKISKELIGALLTDN